MIFTETRLKGAFIIDIERREDSRGFFARAFCQNEFSAQGLEPVIAQANIAFNNIPTTGRVPVDRLWIDSIELSRGPNANIFGLGNASGTVNQVPATANVTRNFSTVELRADSEGGWRASLDTNRVLLGNKLAVRGSYAYQHTGFVRKPSGERIDLAWRRLRRAPHGGAHQLAAPAQQQLQRSFVPWGAWRVAHPSLRCRIIRALCGRLDGPR